MYALPLVGSHPLELLMQYFITDGPDSVSEQVKVTDALNFAHVSNGWVEIIDVDGGDVSTFTTFATE